MPRILVIGNKHNDRLDISAALEGVGCEWRLVGERDAATALAAWSPDVVLVDTPESGFDGAALTAELRAAESAGTRTPIIVLSAEGSVEAQIAALRAGADDYMAKPFNRHELQIRLRGHLARFELAPLPTPVEEAAALGHVLAFYSAKGGSGATTVAINTAIALRRLTGGRVCLVDGNFQFGDHRVFLDIGLDSPGIDAIAAESYEPEIILSKLVRHKTGLDLLLAPKTPERADLVEPDGVSVILEQLRSRYDYVLVDVERSLSERTLRILEISNQIFVIMVPDLSCLKNTRLALDVMLNLNYPAARIRLLLNRDGAFSGIGLDGVADVLGRLIDYRILNDYHQALLALNSGVPMMLADPRSSLGLAFASLAEAINDPSGVQHLQASKGKRPRRRA